ncbi:ribonuclease M5 [Ammoniphilus oxalaticus]|uniref:Ribonuclease M5 n=1 Tax=Ammoniphilus oxalaticus TaxID=66863 RepID=A0A419SGA2_9BACL|nr:ribonuclease M5 [Ammoniphilus oxalaticus]RKD22810.1 ribonuclease M5 [Ammoniphilus oxalaticus]
MMIKEVIVVEGKSDTLAIQRAVQADTIETGGSALSNQVIERIKRAQQMRGVIIFTDPDYPGEKIRKQISQAVPGCKHAFITEDQGRGKRNLGVENASDDVIRKALQDVRTEVLGGFKEEISFQELQSAGLVGGPNSGQNRKKLGELLGVGYANAKQLHKRLNQLQISKREFEAAVDTLGGDEE